jgi:uncharacterized membrane protein YgcG
MKIKRIMQHLVFTDWQLCCAFNSQCLNAIQQAIHSHEHHHQHRQGGEIRFAVEGGLNGISVIKGQTSRERAIEVFSQLKVWDTQHNNGILIYVLLADHAVEIIADRGIHALVSEATWSTICHDMQTAFAQSAFQKGALSGIAAVNDVINAYFPLNESGVNSLPDAPVVLT